MKQTLQYLSFTPTYHHTCVKQEKVIVALIYSVALEYDLVATTLLEGHKISFDQYCFHGLEILMMIPSKISEWIQSLFTTNHLQTGHTI